MELVADLRLALEDARSHALQQLSPCGSLFIDFDSEAGSRKRTGISVAFGLNGGR
jgi:hypothetical protein